MKGGFSTAVLFDSDGIFAVITTQETGAGSGKAAGLSDNFVWGGEGTTVFDYADAGISGSGSFWLLTGAMPVPVYGDDGRVKFLALTFMSGRLLQSTERRNILFLYINIRFDIKKTEDFQNH